MTTYGYARVSTEDQSLDLQIDALRQAGVDPVNIIQEKASGKQGSDRPLWSALLARLAPGDRLVVWKVDRLGRSTLDALTWAQELDKRGVSIVITTLGIDLRTPAGRLVFGVMSQIAEFERELIRERVVAGLDAARRRGTLCGRPKRLTPDQAAEAQRMRREGRSLRDISRVLRVSKSTIAACCS
jgi:DNA invertase Pin-like site-specific DNA recombinase